MFHDGDGRPGVVAASLRDLAAHGSAARVRRLLLDLVTQRYLPDVT